MRRSESFWMLAATSSEKSPMLRWSAMESGLDGQRRRIKLYVAWPSVPNPRIRMDFLSSSSNVMELELLQQVRHLRDAGFGACIVHFLARTRAADAADHIVADEDRNPSAQREDVGEFALRRVLGVFG